MKETLEYIFKKGDEVRSIATGKIYTVEESVHEGYKVYLLPRQQSDERLYNFASELTLYSTKKHKCLNCDKWCMYAGSNETRECPPEENLLIVKSGGTLVAHFKDVDYLCLDPHIYSNAKILKGWQLEMDLKHWKSFSEIKEEGLTDKLALLRPMVITEVLPESNPSKLISVENTANVCGKSITGTFYNCVYNNTTYTAQEARLATPHELQVLG